MFRTARGLSAAGCATAAVLGIAACGSSGTGHGTHSARSGYASHPASSILSDTLKATGAARAFELAGTLRDSGSTLGVTLGYRAPASLSAEITEGANDIRIIVVPAGSYLYANTAFWRKEATSVPARELPALADHWFKTTSAMSSSFTRAFAQLTPAKIASCLTRTFTGPKVTGTRTIDGQTAVDLHSPGRGTIGAADLYVATRTPHYMLGLSQASGSTEGCDGGSGGNETGSITFAHWNHVSITAPAGAKPLP